jgi:hypothetical protein
LAQHNQNFYAQKNPQLPNQPKQKNITKKNTKKNTIIKIIITKLPKRKNIKIIITHPTISNNKKNPKKPKILNQIIETSAIKITKQPHKIKTKTTTTKTPKNHQRQKTYHHKNTLASKRKKEIIKRNRITTQAHNKPTYYKYNYYNKKALLKCGDIESNPGPRYTPLLNHPQIHHERQKTYFYNKTTQIKSEYNHIFELFEPYLKHTQTTNTNHHHKHQHKPSNTVLYKQ